MRLIIMATVRGTVMATVRGTVMATVRGTVSIKAGRDSREQIKFCAIIFNIT